MQHVDSILVYESDFGTLEVPRERMPAKRRVGLFNAEMTRDAFLHGGFESAIIRRVQQCEDTDANP